MEILGDVERLFAGSIYPNRAPIAIGVAVGLVLLGVLAWRRRWDLAARRHPRFTIAAIAAALVIGGPLAWYLGSPLVRSTTVDEPAPAVAGGPAGTPGSATGNESLRSGSFAGADEFHFGRGTATLVATEAGTYVVRLEEFEVRNGPDLFLYLSPSPDGYAQGAVEPGPLKADRGNHNYDVPSGVDVHRFESVVVWCRAFSVEFATARLVGT